MAQVPPDLNLVMQTQAGMSLLDWFAGQEQSAPPQAWAPETNTLCAIRLAEWRYLCASAMLAERKKRMETEDADQGDVPAGG